jgi:hypothetical protein
MAALARPSWVRGFTSQRVRGLWRLGDRMIMLMVVLACPVWILAGVGGGVEGLGSARWGRSGPLFGADSGVWAYGAAAAGAWRRFGGLVSVWG